MLTLDWRVRSIAGIGLAFCFTMPLAAQRLLPKQPVRAEFRRDEDARKLPPPSRLYSLRAPRGLRLAAPDTIELARLSLKSDPPVIGIHRGIDRESMSAGAWESLPDGRRLWRMLVGSPGSVSLRVRFEQFSIGAGKVWIHAENGSPDDIDGPYTDDGVFGDGQFWSASIRGEVLIVEYEQAADRAGESAPPFRLTKVSHQATSLEARGATEPAPLTLGAPALGSSLPITVGPLAGEPDPAAACNLDVNCFSEWTDSAKMVAHIVFEVDGGQAVCSGSLLATRNNSLKPYFLTANHCIGTETEARSVEVFWSYQTSGCRAARPADKGSAKSAVGANLVATVGFGDGDASLLLLRDVPSGVQFAGWDPGDPGLGSRMVGIHHPRGSHKRIAFGFRGPDLNVTVEGNAAVGDRFYIALVRQGVTEPGSSGSPAFSSPGIVIGTLSFGRVAADICAIDPAIDGYGRFSTFYPAARAFLEDIPAVNLTIAPRTMDFRGTNGSIDGTGRQTFTVTTQSRGAVPFNVRSDASWIRVSAVNGSASAAQPGSIEVSVDPKYFKSDGTFTGTVTITSGSAAPQFVTVRVDMRYNRSAVAASVTPSPVVEQAADADGARWFFALRLEESAGVATRLTSLKINGVDYSSRIVEWFGTDRIAAGGNIQARLKMANLFVPSEQSFEFVGVDDGSGQTWSRTISARFLPRP
ncbi:MAG: BACON domain-containing protein [Bryobacteraceae bacterium]